MKCHYCKYPCIKKGKTKSGFQKHYCTNCKKYQQEEYKNKAWYPYINKKIISCLKQSCGIRGISVILEISTVTVIKKIKAIAEQIQKPQVKMKKIYEADELKTYVKRKKNEQWVIYAINKKTKQVADFRLGKRNKTNIKNMISTLLLSKAKKIYTDKLNLYRGLIPEVIHQPVAHNTNYIERKNLNLRTHLKRLSRKTLCFSKSEVMLTACLKIYFWG